MSEPIYASLPPKAFWKTAVAEQDPLDLRGLWVPGVDIKKGTKIATAGSCFAQHFAQALTARGYSWLDCEPAPFGSEALQRSYHYGTFSFRTGNIYTITMLQQWLTDARFPDKAADVFWEDPEGRVFDMTRPLVEPGGFASLEEARASRDVTLKAIIDAIKKADVFVFTLGLTETWINAEKRFEYALCPGTAAGVFNPDTDVFQNLDIGKQKRSLQQVLTVLRMLNPDLHVLLTVSPVPLTATATGQHVLTATQYSKSVLRVVAADIANAAPHVDYFPAYEIITHPVFGGRFYDENQRTVTQEGVDHVMRCFFDDIDQQFGRKPSGKPKPSAKAKGKTSSSTAKRDSESSVEMDDDIACEDLLLEAFAKTEREAGQ